MKIRFESLRVAESELDVMLVSDTRQNHFTKKERETISEIKDKIYKVIEGKKVIDVKSFFAECDINIDKDEAEFLVHLYKRACKEDLCKGTMVEGFTEQQRGIMFSFVYPIAREYGLKLE